MAVKVNNPTADTSLSNKEARENEPAGTRNRHRFTAHSSHTKRVEDWGKRGRGGRDEGGGGGGRDGARGTRGDGGTGVGRGDRGDKEKGKRGMTRVAKWNIGGEEGGCHSNNGGI